MRQIKVTIAALLMLSPFAANADVIALYGDKDGALDLSGFAGTITDTVLLGDQTWTQTFVLDGVITGASIAIGHGFDGWQGLGSRLFLDGIFLGLLSDLDGSGGAGDPGGAPFYAIDVFDLSAAFTALADGVVSITVDTNVPGDGWALDYSEISITTATAVPEPGTLALLGIGLFGMGLARRKQIILIQ